MNKANKKQYRQGDVLLECIDSIQAGAKKRESNVVALGEASNHGHFFYGGQLFDVLDKLFIEVETDAELRHLDIYTLEQTSDHLTLAIPKGKYRVIHQREFDPYTKTINSLRD